MSPRRHHLAFLSCAAALAASALTAQPVLITTSTSLDPAPRSLNASGTWLVADSATLTFANGLAPGNGDGGVFSYAASALHSLLIAPDTTAPNTGSGRALFQNNTADRNGGAISIANSNAATTLALANVTFDANRTLTGYGGALASNRASTLSGVVFTSNTAATNGGAFYNTGTATITGALFEANHASTSGGALYNSGNTATITSATFASNTARTSGGAIFNTGASSTTALTDAVFQGNAATSGGAIYANSGAVTITRATFDSNKTTGTSSSHGGAIFVGNNVAFALASATLAANTAVNNGGALYGTGVNAVITLAGATFTRNEAANGGAIFANSGTFTITGALLESNTAASAGNSHGGAIHNAGATFALTSATLAANTASSNGGAFHNTGANAASTLDDILFRDNSAASGGAIFANAGAVTVRNALFVGNAALSSGGGAIAASTASSVTLTDATFTNNTAPAGNGGAIFANRGALTIRATTSATNTGNKASGTTNATGGFLYITGTGATVTFDITGSDTRYVIGAADSPDRTLDTIASGGSGAAALGHAIIKTGDGALVLNADNSAYRGALVIDAGSLLLGNAAARLNATTATITGGALGGLGTLTGALDFRATSTLFVGDNTPVAPAAPAAPAATPAALIIATTATTGVTLRDGASIGGSGTLLLTGPNNTLTLDTGAIAATVAAGQTLDIATPLAGPGALEKRDAGTLILTAAANTFTGGITLHEGTLLISAPEQLGPATNEIRFTGNSTATLAIDEPNLTLFNPITLPPPDTPAPQIQNPKSEIRNSHTLTLAGPLSSAPAATLIKTGAGTLLIDASAGANTTAFAGTLRASQGALALNTPVFPGNITLDPGARLEVITTLAIGGALSLDTATLAFTLSATTAPDGFLDSDRVHATTLVSAGASTIDLSGFIRTGAYNLGNLAALASTATVTFDGAAQLPDSRRKATLHASGSLLVAETQVDMSRVLLWTGGAGATANLWTSALAGQWTDTGTVNRYADGDHVTFQNASTPVSIQIPVTVSDITITGTTTTTFTGAALTADAASLVTGTLAAATGRLHKTGPGALFLNNAANTFRGGITLDEGAITFTRAAQLDTAGQPVAFTGNATLRLAAPQNQNPESQVQNLHAPVTIAPAATATLDTAATATLVLHASVSGAGALTKTGAGTLALAAPATHTGPTLIQTGTLLAAAPGVLPRNSPLSLAPAATLDLAGHDQTLASLATRGLASLATARLAIHGDYTALAGATLHLSLNLSDTAAPQAGSLAISGSAAGRTTVRIQFSDTRAQAALAPLPAGAPALVTTAAPSPGDSFALAENTRLVVGAYDYLLLPDNAAAAREWRLLPDNFSPEIPAVAGTDAIALHSSRAALDTLLARLDDLRPPATSAAAPGNDFHIWTDTLHRRDTINQTIYTGASITTAGLQAGAGLRRAAAASAFSLGAFADISQSRMKHPRGTTTDATIRGTGLYATLDFRDWRLTAIVRGAKTRHDITARAAAPFKTTGSDFGFTLHAARPVPSKSGWRIVPQATLAYQRHATDDTTDSFGRPYKLDPFTSLAARLALAIERPLETSRGILMPRVRVSALHEFDARSRIHIADDPAPVETNLGGLGAELDASLLWRPGARWGFDAAVSTRAGAKFDGYTLRLGAARAW